MRCSTLPFILLLYNIILITGHYCNKELSFAKNSTPASSAQTSNIYFAFAGSMLIALPLILTFFIAASTSAAFSLGTSTNVYLS